MEPLSRQPCLPLLLELRVPWRRRSPTALGDDPSRAPGLGGGTCGLPWGGFACARVRVWVVATWFPKICSLFLFPPATGDYQTGVD